MSVEAQLYKLLLYEPGSFFVPHRDTEKAPGMFATLSITLPSAHSGGQLVVRHKGQELVFDSSQDEDDAEAGAGHYAAFYADCRHEVKPLLSGHRLALIYNLCYKGGDQVPSAAVQCADTARLVATLKAWDQDDQGPTKLVYMLEHKYTEAGMGDGIDCLKNADRAVADLLMAAKRCGAPVMVHLAEIGKHEQGQAEGGCHYNYRDRYRDRYRHRNHNRRWGRCIGYGSDDDEDEEDEEDDYHPDPSDYTMGDVYENEPPSIEGWVNLDDEDDEHCAAELPDLGIELEAEVMQDPDEMFTSEFVENEEVEEATGNAGATMDRWYKRAAIVIWPRSHDFRIRYAHDLDCAISGITSQLTKWTAYQDQKWKQRAQAAAAQHAQHGQAGAPQQPLAMSAGYAAQAVGLLPGSSAQALVAAICPAFGSNPTAAFLAGAGGAGPVSVPAVGPNLEVRQAAPVMPGVKPEPEDDAPPHTLGFQPAETAAGTAATGVLGIKPEPEPMEGLLGAAHSVVKQEPGVEELGLASSSAAPEQGAEVQAGTAAVKSEVAAVVKAEVEVKAELDVKTEVKAEAGSEVKEELVEAKAEAAEAGAGHVGAGPPLDSTEQSLLSRLRDMMLAALAHLAGGEAPTTFQHVPMVAALVLLGEPGLLSRLLSQGMPKLTQQQLTTAWPCIIRACLLLGWDKVAADLRSLIVSGQVAAAIPQFRFKLLLDTHNCACQPLPPPGAAPQLGVSRYDAWTARQPGHQATSPPPPAADASTSNAPAVGQLPVACHATLRLISEDLVAQLPGAPLQAANTYVYGQQPQASDLSALAVVSISTLHRLGLADLVDRAVRALVPRSPIHGSLLPAVEQLMARLGGPTAAMQMPAFRKLAEHAVGQMAGRDLAACFATLADLTRAVTQAAATNTAATSRAGAATNTAAATSTAVADTAHLAAVPPMDATATSAATDTSTGTSTAEAPTGAAQLCDNLATLLVQRLSKPDAVRGPPAPPAYQPYSYGPRSTPATPAAQGTPTPAQVSDLIVKVCLALESPTLQHHLPSAVLAMVSNPVLAAGLLPAVQKLLGNLALAAASLAPGTPLWTLLENALRRCLPHDVPGCLDTLAALAAKLRPPSQPGVLVAPNTAHAAAQLGASLVQQLCSTGAVPGLAKVQAQVQAAPPPSYAPTQYGRGRYGHYQQAAPVAPAALPLPPAVRFITKLFTTLHSLGCYAPLKQAALHMACEPDTFPVVSVLVPAVEEVHAKLRLPSMQCGVGSWSAFNTLLDCCIEHLTAITSQPLQEPAHWAQPAVPPCSAVCKDCAALNAFLTNPRQTTWTLKATLARLSDVEARIRGANADATTQRVGTHAPYSVVVTKTRRNHQQRMQQRAKDVAKLAQLRGLQGQPQAAGVKRPHAAISSSTAATASGAGILQPLAPSAGAPSNAGEAPTVLSQQELLLRFASSLAAAGGARAAAGSAGHVAPVTGVTLPAGTAAAAAAAGGSTSQLPAQGPVALALDCTVEPDAGGMEGRESKRQKLMDEGTASQPIELD